MSTPELEETDDRITTELEPVIPPEPRIETISIPPTTEVSSPYDFDMDHDYSDQQAGGEMADEKKDVDLTETEEEKMLIAYEAEKKTRLKRRYAFPMWIMLLFATGIRWLDENDGGVLDSKFLFVEYVFFTMMFLFVLGKGFEKIFFWKHFPFISIEEESIINSACKDFEVDEDADSTEAKDKMTRVIARRRG